MIVDVQIAINAPKASVWAAITDIENAAKTISGIDDIEIVEKPASGLVGLRWRETRMLFGKPATAEKWIIEAVENETYTTKAESDGFVFLCIKRIAESSDGTTLAETHISQPQGLVAKLMSIPMSLFFRGVAKKAVMQDLVDIKTAVEQTPQGQAQI